MNRALKYAAIAGIAEIALFIPVFFLGLLVGSNKLGSNLFPLYILINILYLSAFIIFVWGLKIIAEKYQNNLLKYTIYIAIAFTVIAMVFTIVSISYPQFINTRISYIYFLLSGSIGILIGIGLLRLRSQFGPIARAAGTLDVISGICDLTIVLYPLSVVLSILASILVIMMLLNEAKGIKTVDKTILKKIPLGINIICILLILPTIVGLLALLLNTAMLNASNQQKLKIIKGEYYTRVNIASIEKFDNYLKEKIKNLFSPWMLLNSLISLILIFDLSNLKKWARTGSILYSSFIIFLAIMSFGVHATNAARLGAVCQSILSIIIIYHLTRPKVKEEFG